MTEGPCSLEPMANIQHFCSGDRQERFLAQRPVCVGDEGAGAECCVVT